MTIDPADAAERSDPRQPAAERREPEQTDAERREPEPAMAPVRQAPMYGEYAPPGWVSPVPPVDEPTPTPDPDARASSPWAQPPRAYDAPPPTGPPMPGAPPRPLRRSRNSFATMLFLVFGAYQVTSSAFSTGSFAAELVSQFTAFGYLKGDFQHLAALHSVGAWSATLSIALFIATAIVTLRRLRAGRSSWWIPLVAGVVANIGTGIAVIAIVMNDPSYVGVSG